MDGLFLRSWWVLALRGVFAIAFGFLALVWPDLTLLVLVALFAAYALLGGAASVFGAIRHRNDAEDWWLLLLLGLVGLAVAAIAIMQTTLTTMVLVMLIGSYALLTGMIEIYAAIRLRKVMRNLWPLSLSGSASVLFGLLMLLFPQTGALALLGLISFYAVATGVLLLILALLMRSLLRQLPHSLQTERRISRGRRATHLYP